MSNEDDDLFGGEGIPTDEQILKVSAYLKRHNRQWGPRPTHRELLARGFSISLTNVGLKMKKAGQMPVANKDKPAADASHRVAKKRNNNAEQVGKPAQIEKADCELEEGLVSKMAELVSEANSSTQLAIKENRSRMALNIVIAEAMAAKPELLLLDMRGTAALVDALTCGSKLSGGASIDITVGGAKDGADADTMKDITPVARTPLAADLAAFRRLRANGHANGNGKGA